MHVVFVNQVTAASAESTRLAIELEARSSQLRETARERERAENAKAEMKVALESLRAKLSDREVRALNQVLY